MSFTSKTRDFDGIRVRPDRRRGQPVGSIIEADGYEPVRVTAWPNRIRNIQIGNGQMVVTRHNERRELIELRESKKTAELAARHAPIGRGGRNWFTRLKPGNKGQWPAYLQNIRNALMRSGHSVGAASAIALARVRAWAHGGGNVKPEVRAAARQALAEFEKMRGESRAISAAERRRRRSDRHIREAAAEVADLIDQALAQSRQWGEPGQQAGWAELGAAWLSLQEAGCPESIPLTEGAAQRIASGRGPLKAVDECDQLVLEAQSMATTIEKQIDSATGQHSHRQVTLAARHEAAEKPVEQPTVELVLPEDGRRVFPRVMLEGEEIPEAPEVRVSDLERLPYERLRAVAERLYEGTANRTREKKVWLHGAAPHQLAAVIEQLGEAMVKTPCGHVGAPGAVLCLACGSKFEALAQQQKAPEIQEGDLVTVGGQTTEVRRVLTESAIIDGKPVSASESAPRYLVRLDGRPQALPKRELELVQEDAGNLQEARAKRRRHRAAAARIRQHREALQRAAKEYGGPGSDVGLHGAARALEEAEGVAAEHGADAAVEALRAHAEKAVREADDLQAGVHGGDARRRARAIRNAHEHIATVFALDGADPAHPNAASRLDEVNESDIEDLEEEAAAVRCPHCEKEMPGAHPAGRDIHQVCPHCKREVHMAAPRPLREAHLRGARDHLLLHEAPDIKIVGRHHRRKRRRRLREGDVDPVAADIVEGLFETRQDVDLDEALFSRRHLRSGHIKPDLSVGSEFRRRYGTIGEKYPIPPKGHPQARAFARAALRRINQSNLSSAEKDRVRVKAERVLRESTLSADGRRAAHRTDQLAGSGTAQPRPRAAFSISELRVLHGRHYARLRNALEDGRHEDAERHRSAMLHIQDELEHRGRPVAPRGFREADWVAEDARRISGRRRGRSPQEPAHYHPAGASVRVRPEQMRHWILVVEPAEEDRVQNVAHGVGRVIGHGRSHGREVKHHVDFGDGGRWSIDGRHLEHATEPHGRDAFHDVKTARRVMDEHHLGPRRRHRRREHATSGADDGPSSLAR